MGKDVLQCSAVAPSTVKRSPQTRMTTEAQAGGRMALAHYKLLKLLSILFLKREERAVCHKSRDGCRAMWGKSTPQKLDGVSGVPTWSFE